MQKILELIHIFEILKFLKFKNFKILEQKICNCIRFVHTLIPGNRFIHQKVWKTYGVFILTIDYCYLENQSLFLPQDAQAKKAFFTAKRCLNIDSLLYFREFFSKKGRHLEDDQKFLSKFLERTIQRFPVSRSPHRSLQISQK